MPLGAQGKNNNNLIEFLLQCESFRSFLKTPKMICFPVRIKAAILRRLVCRTFSSVDGNADALKLILGLFHFFAREMHREQRKIDVEKVALLFLLARLNKLDSLPASFDSLEQNVVSVKRDVALLVQNTAHDFLLSFFS